jgi:protein-S-isoprenylcysteine O-methyltransferase Ste14
VRFQASEFEFRARFWFIFGLFGLGFSLYFVDRVNVSVALSRLFLGHPDENSAQFGHAVIAFFALGTVFVTLGALFRSWAESYLHSSIVHDAALHTERIVADGPYRRVRNPLYLGTMFLAIGVGFLASRSGFLVIAVGMWIFEYRLILREEATLLESQGESYRRYYAAVPRFLPAVAPRVPASGAKPNWRDGFIGELLMWSAAAAMVIFTVTRNIYYFWAVYGLGLAIYFLQSYMRTRNKPAA